MELHKLIKDLNEKLKPEYQDEHERTQVIWWMLEEILQQDQAHILTHPPTLTQAQHLQLKTWVHKQVVDHEPLQYLIGWVPFIDLKVIVKPPVLIPRPETEYWTENLIEDLKPLKQKTLNILDLCSGSGCIALSLAKAIPKANVMGVDISKEAIALADQNKKSNNIYNVGFHLGDLYEPVVDKQFDLIVANPPYASSNEWKTLDPRITGWEDKHAIWAPDEGLAIIEKIIGQAQAYLAPKSALDELKLPRIVMEIGSSQGAVVKNLFEGNGFKDVKILQDQYGRDRVVVAKL